MNISKYFNIKSIDNWRSHEADVAKGIGILLVIHGHTCSSQFEHVLIGAFHMPLFFFLSGLFLFRKENSFSEFIKQKAKTLLLPCLIFGIILSTYSTVVDILRPNNTMPYGLRYVGLLINMRQYPFPGSLWFLPCLFLVEVFMYGLYKLCRNKTWILIGASILAGFGLLLHALYGSGLPWSIDIALCCTIFTAVGYCVKDEVWNNRDFRTYILCAIILLSSIYGNYLYSEQSVDLYSCRYGNYALFYISAFSGIYITIGFSKLFNTNSMLKYLGQNSLLIYALQFLFLIVINIALSWHFLGWTKGALQTIVILIILNPIINIINYHLKWMTGKV